MMFDVFGKLAGARGESERKLVQFAVGEILCSVDIMRVREIVNPGPVVPLPSSSPSLLGATDHRETVVPVVDLARHLGLGERREGLRTKWVIAEAGGLDLALLVDEVHGVKAVDGSMERERHPLVDGTDVAWVSRVYGTGMGLLFELDLDAMFRFVDAPAGELPEMEESR